MATFRNIQMSFWTDPKVEDDFTPEDKYFYLYLMTNPHTNLAGCYELSLKTMSNETGYNKDTVERLLIRFSEVHNVIRYSKETKEVFIMNWSKYNWTASEKLDKPLLEQIRLVKNDVFREELSDLYNSRDTVSIPYAYRTDTTIPILYNNTISNIISYLNNKCNKNYRDNTKNTIKHIKARLEEGYTEEDFYSVIDYKASQWLNDSKMSDYLRPDTLFGTKFESYLQSAPKKKEIVVEEPKEEAPIDYGWED